jgi:hypothetical protein
MSDKLTRQTDAYRFSNGPEEHFIGDDLTDEQLDQLWDYFINGKTNQMSNWWQDKPHQIGYRLLLRLARAEANN